MEREDDDEEDGDELNAEDGVEDDEERASWECALRICV